MPAPSAKISPARWLALPSPTDAYVNVPGLCRASSTNSFTVLAGTDAWTMSAMGAMPMNPIGAKSLTLS